MSLKRHVPLAALLAVAMLGLPWLLRTSAPPTTVEPPRIRAGNPLPESPGRESFGGRPGDVFAYELSGHFGLRHEWRIDQQRIPIRIRFEDIQARMELRVWDRLDRDWLLSLRPLSVKGRVVVEGAKGLTRREIDVPELAGFAEDDPPLLFRMSGEGRVRGIFVRPPRAGHESDAATVAETLGSFISLFPPLPGAIEADTDYFGQLGIRHRFTPTSGAAAKGVATRIVSFLGAAFQQEQDYPPEAGAVFSTLDLSVDPHAGYFDRVQHRVQSEGEGTSISLSILLELKERRRAESTYDLARLGSLTALPSLDALRPLVESWEERQPRPEPGTLTAAELTALVLELERADNVTLLENRLERALKARPDLLRDLAALVASRPPEDRVALSLVRILSRASTRSLAGAETCALGLMGRIRDDGILVNAFAALQGHVSPAAVDFLKTFKTEHPTVDHMRYVNLGIALQYALQDGRAGDVQSILDFASAALKEGRASSAAARAVFEGGGEAVDAFLDERWKKGSDPAGTLALMVARPSAPRFRPVLETHLFSTFSDTRILGEILPLARAAGNRTLLEFVRDRASAEALRAAAEAQLRTLGPGR